MKKVVSKSVVKEDNSKKTTKTNRKMPLMGPIDYKLFFMLLGITGVLAVFIVLYMIFFTGKGSEISDIKVTNIGPNTATVTWKTEEPELGVIVYSKQNEWKMFADMEGKHAAFEDRDVAYDDILGSYIPSLSRYYTHHVTIPNLEPDTNYYFRILYDSKPQNNYTYPIITTSSNSEVVVSSTPYTLEGVAVLPGGKYKLPDGIVYVSVTEAKTGKESEVVSTTVDYDGNYSLDIGNLLTNDFTETIAYDPLNRVDIRIVGPTAAGSGGYTEFMANAEHTQPILLYKSEELAMIRSTQSVTYASLDEDKNVLGEGDSAGCNPAGYPKVEPTGQYDCDTTKSVYLRVNIEQVTECVNGQERTYEKPGRVTGTCGGDEENVPWTDEQREIANNQQQVYDAVENLYNDTKKSCFGHTFDGEEDQISYDVTRNIDGQSCMVHTVVNSDCSWEETMDCGGEKTSLSSSQANVDGAKVLSEDQYYNGLIRAKLADIMSPNECDTANGYTFLAYPEGSKYEGYGYCYKQGESESECDPTDTKACEGKQASCVYEQILGSAGDWVCLDESDSRSGGKGFLCNPFLDNVCNDDGDICEQRGIRYGDGDKRYSTYVCESDHSWSRSIGEIETQDDLGALLARYAGKGDAVPGTTQSIEERDQKVLNISDKGEAAAIGLFIDDAISIQKSVCSGTISEENKAFCEQVDAAVKAAGTTTTATTDTAEWKASCKREVDGENMTYTSANGKDEAWCSENDPYKAFFSEEEMVGLFNGDETLMNQFLDAQKQIENGNDDEKSWQYVCDYDEDGYTWTDDRLRNGYLKDNKDLETMFKSYEGSTTDKNGLRDQLCGDKKNDYDLVATNKSLIFDTYAYMSDFGWDEKQPQVLGSEDGLPFEIVNGEVVLKDTGLFDLEFGVSGVTAPKIEVKESGAKAKFYLDLNLNGTKDPLEPWVDADDLNLTMTKDETSKPVDIHTGWNLISLPVFIKQDVTASEMFEMFQKQKIILSDVAVLRSGKWFVYSYNENTRKFYGKDFVLGAAEGMFIKSTNNGTYVFTGNEYIAGVPMILNPGWNLVSVVGSQTGYTGISLLEALKAKDIEANQIIRWGDDGRYHSLVVKNGVPFGMFEVDDLTDIEGYFIKVDKGSGVFQP